ncbi:uncharacterized protein [Rutidosis leptorrhynchoides]|uniref:uncharacterized protein isoform X2 n=1 Tax=Rutidosis leptorrhynchoides TaxID=125765 RepID=UPI003A99BCB4
MVVILLTRIQPPCLQALSHNQHQLCPLKTTKHVLINHQARDRRNIRTKSRGWDSNAETFRTRNYDFEDDDFDDEEDTNQWLDILEDFIDVQAFRSFGWMLPAIISSLLLTSGPKAFLMALAIPIGQSALSMLFQTVWGRPKNRTRRQNRNNKKQPRPQPRAASYVDIEDEEEYEKEKKKTAAYQTWVAEDGGSSDKKSSGTSSSFGGWEDLDRKSKPSRNRKRNTTKSKMSRREGRSETPLLLRLLIAVFPFIGSWTRML